MGHFRYRFDGHGSAHPGYASEAVGAAMDLDAAGVFSVLTECGSVKLS